MNFTLEQLREQIFPLNADEQFYKSYWLASRNPETLQHFLNQIDLADAVNRHLVIPELLPDIISYEMNDTEYFKEGEQRNVFITLHNRYTPAFMHRHDFFEIVYVYEGSCIQNIGVNRRTFKEGDLVFIAPGIYHTMEVFDDESIIFNILLQKNSFHRMFLPLATGNDIQSQFFKQALYDKQQLEYLAYHTEKEQKEVILKLYYEHLYHDSYSDQILIGRLTSLSAEMMRQYGTSMESSYSISQTRHTDDFLILNYIQEHIATVTLSDISDHFGFSLSYCSKLIKTTTGMGFNDWKRTLRIRRAEHMLINTGKTVSDISLTLGYENTETFIRAFKKATHMTPNQYRKTNKT